MAFLLYQWQQFRARHPRGLGMPGRNISFYHICPYKNVFIIGLYYES